MRHIILNLAQVFYSVLLGFILIAVSSESGYSDWSGDVAGPHSTHCTGCRVCVIANGNSHTWKQTGSQHR